MAVSGGTMEQTVLGTFLIKSPLGTPAVGEYRSKSRFQQIGEPARRKRPEMRQIIESVSEANMAAIITYLRDSGG